jgi:hypothetical protein
MGDPFNLFDPSDESGESELLEQANLEMNEIGGAPIFYSKLVGDSTQNRNRYNEIVDKIYEEEIELKVGVIHTDVSSELMKFGIDEQLDYLITIDSIQVRDKIQRKPKKGDKIRLWDDSEVLVVNAIPQDVIGYRYHNWFLTCKNVHNENASEADEHNLSPDENPFQFK